MPIAPTPAAFAKTFTAGFAAAVRDAAGGKKRIELKDIPKVDALFADNVKNFLEHKSQKSVDIEKLIAAAHDYAYALADKAAGKDGKLSLADIRNLPLDLADNAVHQRGLDGAKPFEVSALRSIGRDLESLDYVGNMDDRVGAEVKSYTRAKTVDEVKTAVEKSITTGGFWNVDGWRDGETGQKAVDGFIKASIDGITKLAGLDGEPTAPIQAVADRLSAALKEGTYASAQLLHLEIFGPQIADTRAVLVLTGKDGKMTSIAADEVQA